MSTASGTSQVSPGWSGRDVERLLTVKDVAEILGVHFKNVYDLDIPRVKLGRQTLRFRPADVRAYIDAHVED